MPTTTSSRSRTGRTPLGRLTLVSLLTLLPLLAACSGEEDDPLAGADEVAQALATGLVSGDLGDVAFSSVTAQEATDDYAAVTEGMGELEPRVEVGSVALAGGAATEEDADADAADRVDVTLSWSWPIGPDGWSYEAPVSLVKTSAADDDWAVQWSHAVVEPRLTDEAVLDLASVEADRGRVLGSGGQVLVTERPVTRVGVDKTDLAQGAALRSASALAQLTGIEPGPYRRAVAAAGDRAFVEAITYRADEVPPEVQSGYEALEGVLLVSDERALAPTRTFAAPILGTVGEVTGEMVTDDPETYQPGDVAGLSGLQARYDEQLRGTPGSVVSAVGPGEESSVLVRFDPTPGRDLALTLDETQQRTAEDVLSSVGPASALVAIRPSTGEILAAANGPGNDGANLATFGQYAPGSTFKAVTSLALLRAGLTPDSPLTCPPTTTVDGREFGNYSDYPAGGTGTIPLRTAVANSCNTAFISARDQIGDDGLATAAASLGFGVDYDLGFPAFLGSVPPATTETGRAADTIGQGTVEASPMVMASVIGSIQQGTTVIPTLVQGASTTPAADVVPLTPEEAEQLRGMLRGVVTDGSGSVLADVPGDPVIAKTGTAEFEAPDGSTRTHAWMIAARGDLAVAAFVADGASGSSTAGPLLAQFLRAVP